MSSCSVLWQHPLTKRNWIHLHHYCTDTAVIAHVGSQNTWNSSKCGNTIRYLCSLYYSMTTANRHFSFSNPVRMVGFLSPVQIARFGFRKHAVLINMHLINSSGESLEKLLMFNKSLCLVSRKFYISRNVIDQVQGAVHYTYFLRNGYCWNGIFIKQEHSRTPKSIAGLAFTTLFSDVCWKKMCVLVHMLSLRGK